MKKIWVLTRKHRLKTKQAERLEHEAKALKIDLRHVCAEDLDIVVPNIQSDGLPDCIINRTSGAKYYEKALLRSLESAGVEIINPVRSIEIADDKFLCANSLAKQNLPIAKSMLLKSDPDYDLLESEFDYPMILKTVDGCKGEGVLLIENRNQLKDVLTFLRKKGLNNLLAQEFISTSFGRDIRVMVIGGIAYGAALREGASGNFKANVAAGGTASNFELTPEIEQLSLKATVATGLDIAGVDLLFKDNSYIIGEVNSSPDFGDYEELTGINIPKIILEHALTKIS